MGGMLPEDSVRRGLCEDALSPPTISGGRLLILLRVECSAGSRMSNEAFGQVEVGRMERFGDLVTVPKLGKDPAEQSSPLAQSTHDANSGLMS